MSTPADIQRAHALLARLQGTPCVEFNNKVGIPHHLGEMPCVNCVASQHKMPGLVCVPALSGGSCATCSGNKLGCYRVPQQFSGVAQVILWFAKRTYTGIANGPAADVNVNALDDSQLTHLRQLIASGKILRETCILFGKLVETVGRPLPPADDEKAFRNQSNVLQFGSLKLQALQAAWAQTSAPSASEASDRILAIMSCLPENMVPPSFDELHRLLSIMKDKNLLPLNQVTDNDLKKWPKSTTLICNSDYVLPLQALLDHPQFLTARIEHKAIPPSTGTRAGNPGSEYNDPSNVRIYRRLDSASITSDSHKEAWARLREWYSGWDSVARGIHFQFHNWLGSAGQRVYGD